jgi:hypothetical protein
MLSPRRALTKAALSHGTMLTVPGTAPCHASIFSTDGNVIHGPAVEPLSPRSLPRNRLR